MSFANRVNTEVVYYRAALTFIREALMDCENYEYQPDYGNHPEITRIISCPSTSKGLENAILTIICFACCAEACYNFVINFYFQGKYSSEYLRSDNGKKLLRKFLYLPIPKKIDFINKKYEETISKKLKNSLVRLGKKRNYLVHFSEPMRFSGGTILDNTQKVLAKEELEFCFKAINELMETLIKLPVSIGDIRYDDRTIYGQGDLLEYSKPSFHTKLRYVLKHPIWYVAKRIPGKIRRTIKRYRFKQHLLRKYNLLHHEINN